LLNSFSGLKIAKINQFKRETVERMHPTGCVLLAVFTQFLNGRLAMPQIN
jgi:hypothetical protein